MRWKSEGKDDSCTGSEDDNGSVASSNEVGEKLTAAGVRVGARGVGGETSAGNAPPINPK